ncbi:MAG: nucleotidyltransferase domain-containing protein [Clostridia bacterium]|nr:nucleotidyltransferase domain-containing protein [Clostridia bacterium]
MIDMERYISDLTHLLKARFDSRLAYVGLQGSYLRGEATDSSDIDIMVVIDGLSVADLDAYRSAIESLERFDLSCGFICSKADLENWNPLEIRHLLGSTKDYYGALHTLVPAYTQDDIRTFVKLSVNNLYHEICHRYIHADRESSVQALPLTYKGVFFILQNLYCLTHGEFVLTKAGLLPLLEGKDRAVLERSIALSKGETYDFEDSFPLLFTWCQETLSAL